ncbi:MAG: hypothetical protein KA743_01560, partial [Geothrix sp.]|nr:hypothetical protein [Geothrix sp.]
MSALAQGQTLQFQIQGGLCELADSNWRKPTQVSAPQREWPSTGEFLGLSGQSTTWDFGVERALNPRHGVRLLYHRASEGSGAFANRQWALDWVWHLVRRRERTFYTVGGFTLNQVEGTYEFHSGLLPPDGPGDYRVIAQSGRPGIKVGTGFQWSRHVLRRDPPVLPLRGSLGPVFKVDASRDAVQPRSWQDGGRRAMGDIV